MIIDREKERTAEFENDSRKRGAVLLAELKSLVDSFSPDQRREVIKIIEVMFRALTAEYYSRDSVRSQRKPASRSIENSTTRENTHA